MTAWLKRRQSRRDEALAQAREELAFNADMRARHGQPATAAPQLEAELARLAESTRRRRSWQAVGSEVVFDIRDAARRLRRAPGFTAGVVAIVALGLGANSAVFSIANATFFRPLPFADSDRLVRVQEFNHAPDGAIRWVDGSAASLQAMKVSGAFAVAAALNPVYTAVVGRGDADRIAVGAVTAGWSAAVGLRPEIGRMFTPDEEVAGDGAGVAVISDHLWQSHYGGRADIIGTTLSFDGGVRTIVGVLASGYRFPYDQDVWWPTRVPLTQRGLFLVGRLAPGVTFAEANQRLLALGPSLLRDYPTVMHGNVPGARPMREIIIGDDGRVVLLLTWAVALLLLIVASNITMLFVTRLVSREREFAVRAALGCSRGRQVRLLVVESVLVFAIGGALGLGLAAALSRVLVVLLPHVFVEQMAATLPIDWHVVGLTVALVVGCGALVGGLAAWRAPGTDVTEALRATARAGGPASGRRTLGALVVAELALAAVLLSTAITLASGLRQLETRDVGFRTDNLLTWRLELSTPRLASAAAHLSLVDRIEGRLSPLTVPGGVGMSTVNPLCCGDWGSQMTVEGQEVTTRTANVVNYRLVTPSYFSALGLRTLAGRIFDQHDVTGSEPVVMIDDRFARRYWPGENAVGKRVKRGPGTSTYPWMRVVGVVSSIEDAGDYTETWYLPYRQYPDASSTEDLHLWTRTSDFAATAALVRSTMRDIDPALPVIDLRSMEDIKQEALTQRRHAAVVAAAFGGAGIVLALCGVYALVAFVVTRERRDIGVRLALGASGSRVLTQVVGRLLRLGSVGIMVGMVLARFVEPQVVHALGARPMTFWVPACAIAVTLLLATAVAAWLPARRVLSIDPVRVLSD